MKKLLTMFALLGVVALAIPSCAENDDFADVVLATDMEKEAPANGDDDKEDGDQGPGGG